MKYLFLTLLLTLSGLLCFAQSFEGEIVYNNTYKSKMPSLTDEKFTAMMGTTQNYYIKDGAYRSETNGTLVQWQIYINPENRLYSKSHNSETVIWNDGAENDDEVISSQLNKGVIELLGYKCDELILNCKSGVQKYYFTSKLPVDYKLFEKHKFGNFAFYLSMAHAIPLKMIVETAQYAVESTATQIKPMKLDNTMFKLPAGVHTAKNPN
ncbi:MAG: hypothetical protein ABI367_07755 [Mucilaginibacter sp.]